MKKFVVVLAIFLLPSFVLIGSVPAALSTDNQNIRDLMVMVRFIETHRIIAFRLKSINFKERTIYYFKDRTICYGGMDETYKVVFARGKNTLPPGSVGPAPYLEFKSTNDPELREIVRKEQRR
jgi:hypothetical protein